MPAPLHRPIGAPLICRFSPVVCSNLHRKRFFALHLKRCFVSRPSIPVNRERVGMETLLENSVNCTHGTRLDSVRGQRSRERNVDRGKMGEDERGRERTREAKTRIIGTMLQDFNSGVLGDIWYAWRTCSFAPSNSLARLNVL